MSLKSFHIFFIAASIVLSAISGMWFFEFFETKSAWVRFGGAGLCFAAGGALLYYGVKFLEKFKRLSFMSIVFGALLPLALPQTVQACTVCFGDPTSPLQNGVDAAIWTLLGCVAFVLTAIGGFGIYFTRRAVRVNGFQDREFRVLPVHAADSTMTPEPN